MRLHYFKSLSIHFIGFQVCEDLGKHFSFDTFMSYRILKLTLEEFIESVQISKGVYWDLFALHLIPRSLMIRFVFAGFAIEQVIQLHF